MESRKIMEIKWVCGIKNLVFESFAEKKKVAIES